MRIKELDDILKLVEQMPADRQMRCVQMLSMEVQQWEDRASLGDLSDREYHDELMRRFAEKHGIDRAKILRDIERDDP